MFRLPKSVQIVNNHQSWSLTLSRLVILINTPNLTSQIVRQKSECQVRSECLVMTGENFPSINDEERGEQTAATAVPTLRCRTSVGVSALASLPAVLLIVLFY